MAETPHRSSVPIVSLVPFVAMFVSVAFAAVLSAQTFRGGVYTVQVTVTVTDTAGRLILGLSRDDFEVFEEGDPQPITQFSDKRVPVSLGVLLDASDSMRGQPINDAREAVDRFVGELLEPVDQAFVGTFNHFTRLVSPWTQPPARLRDQLDRERPSGGTALYDALVAAAPVFVTREHPRAALVLVSDGADTASDHSLGQARDALRRTDAFVYAIAIDSEQRISTRVNPDALREITGPTGGYTEIVRAAADLGPATERIARELNSQYTLGYATTRPPDGTWRAIRVHMKSKDYLARSRRGYYADPPSLSELRRTSPPVP